MQPAQRCLRSLNPRQWPGERDPTRWDAHEATENLEATFLERFRVALLHSEGFGDDDDALAVSESAGDSSEEPSPVSEDAPFGCLATVPRFQRLMCT